MTSRHDAPNTRYRFQPEVDGLLQAEARLPAAEGSTLIVSHSQRRQELPGLTKNAGCPLTVETRLRSPWDRQVDAGHDLPGHRP